MKKENLKIRQESVPIKRGRYTIQKDESESNKYNSTIQVNSSKYAKVTFKKESR